MPLMSANGAQLYYEEYGGGPDVVLSAQNRITSGPESYLELLAAAGLHVYSIELRGFGRSSPASGEPHGGWYPTWAEDVYQFARGLGVARFLYSSVSHGAGVGWNLVLMSRTRCARSWALSADRMTGPNRACAAGHGQRADVSSCRPTTLYACAVQRVGSNRTSSLPRRRPPSHQPGQGLSDLDTNEQVAARLSQVSVPTLLLNGAQDDLIPAEMALLVARAVRGAKLVLFQDHSHTLAREAPERLVDEVMLFLKEIGSR